MAIVSRNTKGSALTHAELDGNFADLDNRISTRVDSSTIISMINNETLDSAETISIITATVDVGYIQSRQADLQRDSSFISNIVDSDYVQARQTSGGGGGLDSATAIALIDSDYVQARQTSGGAGSIDSAATVALIDSDYIEARIGTINVDSATVDILRVNPNSGGTSTGISIGAGTTANQSLMQDSSFILGIKNNQGYVDITAGADINLMPKHGQVGNTEGIVKLYYHHPDKNYNAAATKHFETSKYGIRVHGPAGNDKGHITADSATLTNLTITGTLVGGGSVDSATTIALIDSDYVQARQITAAANPAGSNTQVQFNDGGSSFGGDAGLVYSKDSDKLTAVNLTVSGTLTTTTAGTPTITANSNLLLKVGGSVVVQADSAGNGAGFRVGTRTTTQRNALSASDGEIIYNSTIGQFDIYQRSAWQPLTKGSAIFNVVNNGSSDYAFTDAETHWFPTSTNDPVLYLRRGETYYFVVNASGHPFQIRVSNGGSAYTTGVTNNGAATGTVVFKVPMAAPATLYYQCTNHSGMGNTINIV
jgi:hypothetical protein